MKKTQSWLGGLLVLQLLIGSGLLWYSQQRQTQNQQQPLLSFEKSQIDRIVITGGGDDNNIATIQKADNKWQLPELQQLPANNNKLTDLLNKLDDLRSGWPVATTTSSRERFEVEKDTFQRRLQLYQGDTLAAELLVGTSPGFRKVHIRKSDDDAIYAVSLNSYELPPKNDDWLDKSLLAANEISSIKGPDYALQKTQGNWVFDNGDSAEQKGEPKAASELDIDKVKQLVSALTSLRVQSLAPALEDKTTAMTLNVSGPKGDWIYQFIQADDKYYVSRSDRDTVFSINKSEFEYIAQIRRTQLLDTSQTDKKPAENTDPSSS